MFKPLKIGIFINDIILYLSSARKYCNEHSNNDISAPKFRKEVS